LPHVVIDVVVDGNVDLNGVATVRACAIVHDNVHVAVEVHEDGKEACDGPGGSHPSAAVTPRAPPRLTLG
jgi:hypothetical protein